MSYTPSVQDAELAKIIGSEPARGRFGVLRWLIAAFAFALVTGGFLFFQSVDHEPCAPVPDRTAPSG